MWRRNRTTDKSTHTHTHMTFVILFDEDYGTIHVQQHSNVHVERYISLHVHTLLLLSNYTLFTAVFPLLQKHAAPNPDLLFLPKP